MIDEQACRLEAVVPSDRSSKWLRVTIYYVIAIGFSALSRLYWHTNDVTGNWPSLDAMLWHLVSGVGPFIGALVIWLVFRPQRTMTFRGTSPSMAWAMLAVPAVTMAAMGVPNSYGISPHSFGGLLGAWIAAYATLEETGWRGYLQGEFRNRPPLLRYVIVGMFWYPWHLTFLQHHSFGTELAILSLIVSTSVGIGLIADRTRSILAAASLHIIGNIMGLTAYFTIFIPSLTTRLTIVGFCIVVWIAMLRIWRVRAIRSPAGLMT